MCIRDRPGPLSNCKASFAGWERNPKGGERESLDDLSPLSNNDLSNINITNNNILDTLSDRPGRYPDRAVLHCRNVGVTEPSTWPSMPPLLSR